MLLTTLQKGFHFSWVQYGKSNVSTKNVKSKDPVPNRQNEIRGVKIRIPIVLCLQVSLFTLAGKSQARLWTFGRFRSADRFPFPGGRASSCCDSGWQHLGRGARWCEIGREGGSMNPSSRVPEQRTPSARLYCLTFVSGSFQLILASARYGGMVARSVGTTWGFHGIETMWLKVFTGESSEPRVSWMVQDVIHPQYV